MMSCWLRKSLLTVKNPLTGFRLLSNGLAFRLFRPEEKSSFKKVLSTQYSSFDPLLKINNAAIKFIGDDDPPMFKYLGRFTQYDLKDDLVRKQVEAKLLKWLDTIENSGLDGRMKAWIVNFHVF